MSKSETGKLKILVFDRGSSVLNQINGFSFEKYKIEYVHNNSSAKAALYEMTEYIADIGVFIRCLPERIDEIYLKEFMIKLRLAKIFIINPIEPVPSEFLSSVEVCQTEHVFWEKLSEIDKISNKLNN